MEGVEEFKPRGKHNSLILCLQDITSFPVDNAHENLAALGSKQREHLLH